MIFYLKYWWYSRNLKTFSTHYHHYLSKYNDYYNNLTPELQMIFRQRVYVSCKFIDFKPVDFPEVTREMKILISSALIQITFGLDRFILKRFQTIMVVPNTYSFREYKALLGHVDNEQDLIAMSWPSVKKGFVIPHDAHNVALHELAHALHREHFDGQFFNGVFENAAFAEWDAASIKTLEKIRTKNNHYLGKYAGQNMLELFAVSIECFFEQPEVYKEEVPKLFKILTKVLKQDPTINGDPRL